MHSTDVSGEEEDKKREEAAFHGMYSNILCEGFFRCDVFREYVGGTAEARVTTAGDGDAGRLTA